MKNYETQPPQLALELEQFFSERFPDLRVGISRGIVFDFDININGQRAASVQTEACEYYDFVRAGAKAEGW